MLDFEGLKQTVYEELKDSQDLIVSLNYEANHLNTFVSGGQPYILVNSSTGDIDVYKIDKQTKLTFKTQFQQRVNIGGKGYLSST